MMNNRSKRYISHPCYTNPYHSGNRLNVNNTSTYGNRFNSVNSNDRVYFGYQHRPTAVNCMISD